MNLVKILKSFVAPSGNEQLAKLDAHLLADFGVVKTFTRHDSIFVPADLGVRLV